MKKTLLFSLILAITISLFIVSHLAFAAPRSEARVAYFSNSQEINGCPTFMDVGVIDQANPYDDEVYIYLESYECSMEVSAVIYPASPSEFKIHPLLKSARVKTSASDVVYPSMEEVTVTADLKWEADMNDWQKGSSSTAALVSGTISIPELGVLVSFDKDPNGSLYEALIP